MACGRRCPAHRVLDAAISATWDYPGRGSAAAEPGFAEGFVFVATRNWAAVRSLPSAKG